MLQEKINVLRDSENYVGKYFSKSYINKHVLGFTDTQIEQIQQEIQEEAAQESQQPEVDQFEESPEQKIQLLQ